jgi:hypothetical protein
MSGVLEYTTLDETFDPGKAHICWGCNAPTFPPFGDVLTAKVVKTGKDAATEQEITIVITLRSFTILSLELNNNCQSRIQACSYKRIMLDTHPKSIPDILLFRHFPGKILPRPGSQCKNDQIQKNNPDLGRRSLAVKRESRRNRSDSPYRSCTARLSSSKDQMPK